jgi:hypothetical protein
MWFASLLTTLGIYLFSFVILGVTLWMAIVLGVALYQDTRFFYIKWKRERSYESKY